jgi:transposase
MDTRVAKRRHKRWPEALKREIVAATSEPGASVSMVARRYDVNANQVFSWRRRYREASEPSPASLPTPRLLPVTIAPAPGDEPAAPSALAASDTIEIEVSGTYRVRVGSGFDPRSLKRVLDVLRRR